MKISSSLLAVALGLMTLILATSGCGTDDPGDSDTSIPDSRVGDLSGPDEQSGCRSDFRPIVFVHGFLEEGDAFYTQTSRLASNGYCLDDLRAFDFNGVSGYDQGFAALVEFIDEVLADSGHSQVDLVGHSFGGILTFRYVTDPQNADKIAHLVHIAGYPNDPVPNGVPTLTVSSEADMIMGVRTVPNATNRIFSHLDHLQTATSPETFSEMFAFFQQGRAPETTEVVSEQDLTLSGRTVAYAINTPMPGIVIEIYTVDPATGRRLRTLPDALLRSDSHGYWGPFEASPHAYYEFNCIDPLEFWPDLHYYREPFLRSNDKVYFRVYPSPTTTLGEQFMNLPLDDSIASFSWININQSVVSGRDTFTVNGQDLATPEMADAEATLLVIVFGDVNENGVSDNEPAGGLYSRLKYFKFFDLLVGTESRQSIEFVFNGRKMAVPNWKAASEGLSIAVFE